METSSRYFPYQQRKAKPNRAAQPAETPTWHEQQGEDARGRIKQAIALMLDSGTLPMGATARFTALTQSGIGGGTLYRHKDLWHPEYLMPGDNPPHPPSLDIEREEDAPKCPNLLALKSSNAPSGRQLSGAKNSNTQAISSNTQEEKEGVEFVRQKLAETEEVQAYQRAAQLELWQQYEQVSHPSPAHLDNMRRWLESGDVILVAEAEVFFGLMQKTSKGSE